ncbi:ABC transporter substrate-binding protein [Spirochaeta dissipatitropha]
MNRLHLLLISFMLLTGIHELYPDEMIPENPVRLLVIDSQVGEPYTSILSSLFQSLQSRGFIPGDSMIVQRYSLGNESGAIRRIQLEEAGLEYDIVLVNGTIAAMAAQEIIGKDGSLMGHDKVFFAGVTDPVGLGLIDDYAVPPPGAFTGTGFTVDPAVRLRVLRELLPEARTIGLVYSEMPQSIAYRAMLEKALEQPELSDLSIEYRSVEFITGEKGYRRSVQLAREHILELDPIVDVFMSPSDQMGVHYSFSRMVFETAEKPLIGLSPQDVNSNNGASAAVFSSYVHTGEILADQMLRYLAGEDFRRLHPEIAQPEIAIHDGRAARFNMMIPDPEPRKVGQ